jgi:hypothetical protein
LGVDVDDRGGRLITCPGASQPAPRLVRLPAFASPQTCRGLRRPSNTKTIVSNSNNLADARMVVSNTWISGNRAPDNAASTIRYRPLRKTATHFLLGLIKLRYEMQKLSEACEGRHSRRSKTFPGVAAIGRCLRLCLVITARQVSRKLFLLPSARRQNVILARVGS